ncbi:MAG: urease subunit gamma, partial [Trebonia sp.]
MCRRAFPGGSLTLTARESDTPQGANERRREYLTLYLTPSDTEKLMLSVAGMVARDRRARGVLLNYP